MYELITNPKNNQLVNINSALGKQILVRYLNVLNGGGFFEGLKELFKNLNPMEGFIPDDFIGDIRGDILQPNRWGHYSEEIRKKAKQNWSKLRHKNLKEYIIKEKSKKAKQNWSKLRHKNLQKYILKQLNGLNTKNFMLTSANTDTRFYDKIIDIELTIKNRWVKKIWNEEWDKHHEILSTSYSNLESNRKIINFFNGNSLKWPFKPRKVDDDDSYYIISNKKDLVDSADEYALFNIYNWLARNERILGKTLSYIIASFNTTINNICPMLIRINIKTWVETDPVTEEETRKCKWYKIMKRPIWNNSNWDKITAPDHLPDILRDILEECHRVYYNKKVFIKLLIYIKDEKIWHSNSLIFERNIGKKGDNGEWNIYRHEPNGDSLIELDEYFKELFSDEDDMNYKGILGKEIYTKISKFKKITDVDADFNPSGTCSVLSYYILYLICINVFTPIKHIIQYVIMKIKDLKNLRLKEELIMRYIIELLPQINLYFTEFTISPESSQLIKEIVSSPIMTDNDGREITKSFNNKFNSKLSSNSISYNDFIKIYKYISIKEMLNMNIIVEFNNYENENDTGRVNCYYKIKNINVIKGLKVYNNKTKKELTITEEPNVAGGEININNTSSDINCISETSKQSEKYGLEDINFLDKEDKKAGTANKKISKTKLNYRTINIEFELYKIIKPYMRYTRIKRATSLNKPKLYNTKRIYKGSRLEFNINGVILSTDDLSDLIKGNEIVFPIPGSIPIESLIIKNYFDGNFKIFNHYGEDSIKNHPDKIMDEFEDINIRDIRNLKGRKIYKIDSNQQIQIKYNKTLLKEWGIKNNFMISFMETTIMNKWIFHDMGRVQHIGNTYMYIHII